MCRGTNIPTNKPLALYCEDMMRKYLVERTVKFSKVIEANSKREAIEEFGDWNANQELIKETAKILHGSEPKNLPGGKL